MIFVSAVQKQHYSEKTEGSINVTSQYTVILELNVVQNYFNQYAIFSIILDFEYIYF